MVHIDIGCVSKERSIRANVSSGSTVVGRYQAITIQRWRWCSILAGCALYNLSNMGIDSHATKKRSALVLFTGLIYDLPSRKQPSPLACHHSDTRWTSF